MNSLGVRQGDSPSEHPSTPANGGCRPLRVLLAEDSPDDAEGVERALWGAGFAPVVQRIDDEGGLLAALALDEAWDVVLADHALPGLAVARVLEVLREAGGLVPCIVVSGTAGEEAAVAALKDGAGDFLSRANLQHLGSAVERVVREAGERQLRRQTELALRQSEERHRTLLENAFDLISETDLAGHFCYVSPNFRDVLGFEPDAMLGTSVFDWLHPDDLLHAQQAVGHGLETGNGRVEIRYKHRDGGWKWLESAGRILQNGHCVFISRDVSERRQREAELRALVSLSESINAQDDLPSIARALSVHLQSLLPFEMLGIALLSDDQTLTWVAGDEGCHHFLGMPVMTREAQPDQPVWRALEKGEVWLENHWHLPNRLSPSVRAVLAAPLIADGKTLGLFHVSSIQTGVYLPEHARLAEQVAGQVAVAVRQTNLLDQARRAEKQFRELFESSPDAIFVESLDGMVLDVNPAACRLHRCERSQLVGRSVLDLVPAFQRDLVAREFPLFVSSEIERVESYSFPFVGEPVPVEINASRIEYNGAPALLLHVRDITGRKEWEIRNLQAQAELAQSNAVLQATQEAAADGIFLVDDRGQVVSFNRRFIEMWDIAPDETDALQQGGMVLARVLGLLSEPDEFIEKIGYLFDHPDASSRDEIALRDGRTFERYSAPARGEGGQLYGRVWSFSDITERKQYEQQLAHQAFHDPLTGLPNRALFTESLLRGLSRLARTRRPLAVLFLDLDRFKVVNDSLGHEQGDALLLQVAGRLRECLRPGDIAARFGGDEFALLLEEVRSPQDATHVAERVQEAMSAPFVLSSASGIRHEFHTGASVGIVIGSDGADSPDDLLRKADVAMYRAKNAGRGGYALFDTRMSSDALERLQMEVDLRGAIKTGTLELHYQPIVRLSDNQVLGIEALCRWNRAGRGLVTPNEFIPIAEETGLILPLGDWVLREACGFLSAEFLVMSPEIERPHSALRTHHSALQLSVNLSARQWAQRDLTYNIERVLRETGLSAARLKLEITESVAMNDAEATVTQLRALKEQGVQLAIDDFGTGYSSLAYLQKFPLDTLKIDRSFVSRLGQSSGDEAIVRAVSTLGASLGLEVTGEGVETPAHLSQLRDLGCHSAQGFLLSRPLPREELIAWLRAQDNARRL